MLSLCLASLLLSARQTPIDSTYRWFQLSTHLLDKAQADRAVKVIDEAAAAGYNGVVFSDTSLTSLPAITPAYQAALDAVLSECKKSNIEFIPMVAPLGDAAALLSRDVTLAESLPCHAVRFTVTNNQLKPADPVGPIANNGFEQFAGDLPAGFVGAHKPDVVVAQDTAVKHGGASALRVDGVAKGDGESLTQTIPVKPWHQYRLSLWTKTAGPAGSQVFFDPRDPLTKMQLGFSTVHDSPDWVKNDIVFNSKGDTQAVIEIGVRPLPTAKVWLDDLTIEDVGLLNVTRREDCPLVIQGDDGIIYNEAFDVAPIRDVLQPKGLDTVHFDISHPAPLPFVLGNSRLHEGMTVTMDFWAASIVEGRPQICISEDKAKALFKREIERTVALTRPHFIFLDIEQVDTLGYDPACDATSWNAGQILGNFVKDEEARARAIDKSIQVVTYGELFDPNNGSKDAYVLTKGGTTGSANYLPKDTIIVNWEGKLAADTLSFFSHAGFQQVLFGYCDNSADALPITQWEKLAGGMRGVKGFGYATWNQDYSHLAEFIHEAKGAAR